jgi:hypothetical protein
VLRTAFYLNQDRILPAAPPITPKQRTLAADSAFVRYCAFVHDLPLPGGPVMRVHLAGGFCAVLLMSWVRLSNGSGPTTVRAAT